MTPWWRRCMAGFDTPDEKLAPPRQEPVPNTRLRVESRDACFPFVIHLLVRYALRPETDLDNPFLIAQAGIDRRVRQIASGYPLTERAHLRGELELSLSRRLDVERTGVIAWASCLEVEVNEQLVEFIRRYETLRREETVRVWSHTAEEAEIAHLSRLLKDPQRATAWWFRRNQEAVQRLPEVAATFIDLEGRFAEDSEGDSWDALFEDVRSTADPAARHFLAFQIRRVLEDNGLADLAHRAGRLDGEPPRAG